MADADEIARGFNSANDKKHWKARALGQCVTFTAQNGMVRLLHDPAAGTFRVVFCKMHGAWGDYIAAIGKALFTVLNTLKAAGLPYEAPQTLDGITITATLSTTDDVLVAWVNPAAPRFVGMDLGANPAFTVDLPTI